MCGLPFVFLLWDPHTRGVRSGQSRVGERGSALPSQGGSRPSGLTAHSSGIATHSVAPDRGFYVYTLNLHNVLCQVYLNELTKKKTMTTFISFFKLMLQYKQLRLRASVCTQASGRRNLIPQSNNGLLTLHLVGSHNCLLPCPGHLKCQRRRGRQGWGES